MPLTEQRDSGDDADRQAGAVEISEEEIRRVIGRLYRLLKRDDPEAFLGNPHPSGAMGRTPIDGNFRLRRIAKGLILFLRQPP